MQVFRLYFNPKIRRNKIIADFVYEPVNIEERKLGNLYMLGELSNISSQNFQFLNRLNLIIKKNYYQSQEPFIEKNFTKTLKRTNEFLFNQAKAGDVSWLGHLNFLILNLSPLSFKKNQMKSDFLFTKTGKIEAVLLRENEIINIGQGSTSEQIATYPLKIFKTIISGELEQGDILLLFSKEIYNYFLRENLLKKFIFLREIKNKNKETDTIKKSGQEILKIEQKRKEDKLLDRQEAEFSNMIKSQIKNLIYSKEKELLEASGICLLIVLRQANRRIEEEYSQKQTLIFEKMASRCLISQICFSFNKKIKNSLGLFKKHSAMIFPILFRKLAAFLIRFRRSKEWPSLIGRKFRFLKTSIKQKGLKLINLLAITSLSRFWINLLATFRSTIRAIKQFYSDKVKGFLLFLKTHRAKKVLTSIIILIFILLMGHFLFR